MPERALVRVESTEELLEKLSAAPVRALPSDNEDYDRFFPDHPLSLVRSILDRTQTTAALDDATRLSRPFRLHRG